MLTLTRGASKAAINLRPGVFSACDGKRCPLQWGRGGGAVQGGVLNRLPTAVYQLVTGRDGPDAYGAG